MLVKWIGALIGKNSKLIGSRLLEGKFFSYKLLTGSYFPYDNVRPTLNELLSKVVFELKIKRQAGFPAPADPPAFATY